ncbi:FtsH protease activity modulator HflK [candidate division KSB1 bacterium]|nr:FtsH protease activity modulator HflK [candidate division KSB1 bacterium]NIR69899.1 FtsH protease activity modulator HflK [candidate division KSB1 bacterium]NIS23001.1 FtsH protease activity modulator HflK [candidate division KSB1 bacterium]NIT69859.1 FtsH protease activity modulator HflK [candidate division KSB1 bacterium]NIU23508.1 FtsH protease activity modulator HflK [candidate division KSB1 bacterium]
MARKTINVGGEIVELPDVPKKWVYIGLVAILGLIFVFTSFYTIQPNEKGVIQRFGAYVRSTDSGLHFKLPFFIETVKKVPVEDVLKQEFGFRTAQAGVRTRYASGDFSDESLMLTGDLNSASVEWIVQYRIQDPVKYLFNVRNVEGTLRDVSESVMRQVVGDRSVDEVIVLSRQEIEDEAHQLTQQVLDEYETGLKIVTVKLQDVVPPEPVQPAFNEVNEARQEKESIINEALSAYNKVIPKAEGQAKQTISEAEGYATNRINRARGDAEKFLAVWREYNKAKDVTKRRLYLETMLDILPNFENIYVVDEQQTGLIPLLQFPRTKEVASK